MQFAETMRALHPFLIDVTLTQNWPGTQTLGPVVQLFRFRSCPKASAQLPTLVEGLYDWQQPGKPEDLGVGLSYAAEFAALPDLLQVTLRCKKMLLPTT
jgi:hypothetical protein